MAFGKKKDDAPNPDSADAVGGDAPADEAPVLEPEAAPESSPAVQAVAEAPAEAAGGDALLSMFSDSKTDSVNDLAGLVDLAGETDLDDILEELRTLRAALGITDAFDEEEDFAAAA
jgi:hypothetical protein